MELFEKKKRRIRVEQSDNPFIVAQGFVEVLREAGITVEVSESHSEESQFQEYLIDKSSRRLM